MAAAFDQFETEVEMAEGEGENGDKKNVQSNRGDGDFEEESVDVNKAERKILRAKKLVRRSPSKEEGISNGTVPLKVALLGSKNSRKSRTGRRGLPKKGGAGGKGTWGKPGSELFAEDKAVDVRDPNYDSDNQDVVVEAMEPELTEEEFNKAAYVILAEYLEHGDTNEVAESLSELNIGPHVHHIPVVAVNIALDRKNTHREMISVLLSDLYGRLLEQEDFSKSFDELITDLPDLKVDCPTAPVIIGQFVARAIADDCLPPKYIQSWKGKVECDAARAALERADVLLSMKHGIVRLDNVWGVGGGIRPVKSLIKKIVMLVKEYLSASDIPEATQCLKDLEVPHFHHELIYEGTMIVLEDSGERSAQQMAKLFKSLCDTAIVTPDQMTKGLQRIFEDLPDICIDVPNANFLLERFVNMCADLECVPDQVMRDLPGRGRKRFVSEGDGGLVKDMPPFRVVGVVKENPV